MPKKPKPGLAELQAQANQYAMDYLRNTPLGLPDLSEGDFTKVMDAVAKTAVQAWAAGYKAGTER
jgi:hypothetical protein